jgi:hypothetical protein
MSSDTGGTIGHGSARDVAATVSGDLPDGVIPAQRTGPSPATTPETAVQSCRCGHGSAAHEHFRAGSECVACDCTRYRTTVGLATQLASVLRRGR